MLSLNLDQFENCQILTIEGRVSAVIGKVNLGKVTAVISASSLI
jgi:hypothetical protein